MGAVLVYRGRRKGSHVAERDALLAVYLNDHPAGATLGVRLFHRATRSARWAAQVELSELTRQVEQDRKSLRAVMRGLGVTERPYKMVGGWLLERAARVKLNGHLLRRSPLTDLVELEGLVLGVQGKAAGFRALRRVAAPGDDLAELDRLIGRAGQQAEVLELRLDAAARIFHCAP